MKVHKIGKGFGKKTLSQALQIADSGDVCILDKNYSENIGFLIISKDVTIVGAPAEIPGNNERNLTNTLTGKIVIRNKCTVKLQFLILQSDKKNRVIDVSSGNCRVEDCSIFSYDCTTYTAVFTNNSTIEIYNSSIIIDFVEDQATDRPHSLSSHVVWAKDSDIKIIDSIIKSKNSNDEDINFIDCNFEICNSFIENIKMRSLQSKGKINSLEYYNKDFCLSATESTIHVKNSKFNSEASIVKDKYYYPTVEISNTNFTSEACVYSQKTETYSAISLKENSIGYFTEDTIDWMTMRDSKALIKNSKISANMLLVRSYAFVNDLNLINHLDAYYYVTLLEYSVMVGDSIYFDDHENTLINLKSHSTFAVRQVFLPEYFDYIYDSDEDSYIIENFVDFEENDEEESQVEVNAYEQLQNMIGLQRIKDEVEDIRKVISYNEKRMEMGQKTQDLGLYSIFMGNPGTGKKTAARLLGKILCEMGVFDLDDYEFIEVDESDLLSNYGEGTANNTKQILESALGGVLYIDKANTLSKMDDAYGEGTKAIKTILNFINNHPDEIMVIFSGYPKEMEEFLRVNKNFSSFIGNHKIIFDDYTSEEIAKIGLENLSSEQYTLEDETHYKRKVKQLYERSLDRSNGHWILSFNEGLIKSFISSGSDEDNVSTITNSDIEVFINKNNKYRDNDNAAYKKLKELVGVNNVKKQIDAFISTLELNKRREEQGLVTQSITLHSCFLGNPGTGKTTVARLLGEILYHKGITKDKKFVEVSRSDLVAGYLGQTAIKTKSILESALGGVLFIDEAYTLHQDDRDSFGTEAIDTILKFMEDYRNDIVIIFAGYSKEMETFLDSNPGLRSRVPNKFIFEDYTIDELVEIGLLDLQKQKYKVDEEQYRKHLTNAYEESKDHDNGRFVRNFNDKIITNLSMRLAKNECSDILLIEESDYPLKN